MLAANSGVMPQTREHIILAKQIGLEKLIVFLNKADLVDESTLELCEDEVREMLSDHGFDGVATPVIAGSAKMALEGREEEEKQRSPMSNKDQRNCDIEVKEDKFVSTSASIELPNNIVNSSNTIVNGNNAVNIRIPSDSICSRHSSLGVRSVSRLLSTMDDYFASPSRDSRLPSLLPISSIYSIPGRGTVVAGILRSGSLKKGDSVDVLGYDKSFKSTVGNIETFHKTMTETEPGDNIGVLLRGVKKSQLKRGMIIAKAGSAKVNNRVKARVYLLYSDEGGLDEPLCQGDNFRLFCHSFDIITNVNQICWSDSGYDGDRREGGDLSGVTDDRQMVMPGQEATMEMMIYRKLYLPVGSRFTLRKNTLTVGYGVVTEVLADADEAMLKKRWRKWKIPLLK